MVGWIASIATFAAANLAYYSLATVDHNPSAVHQALYNIFSRLLWALAIAYVVFACIHGYGGPVNRFLSLPFWQPLSRLSYAMYLVSVPLMVVSTGSMKHASFFSGLSLVSRILVNDMNYETGSSCSYKTSSAITDYQYCWAQSHHLPLNCQ